MSYKESVMCKKSVLMIVVCLLAGFACQSAFAKQDIRPGLAGTYFNSRTFKEPDLNVDILKNLDPIGITKRVLLKTANLLPKEYWYQYIFICRKK